MKPIGPLLRGAPRQVLIVSGDVAVCNVAERALKSWAIEATTVHTGHRALESISEQDDARVPYPLAVVDSPLPDMSVSEFVERLRSLHNQSGPTLIALVAPNDAARISQNDPLGVVAYVIRTPGEAEFSASLRKAIESAMAHRVVVQDSALAAIGSDQPSAPVEAAHLLERLDGDRELLVDLIDVFVANRLAMVEQLDSAIARNDPKALQQAAHRAKGAISNLCTGPAYLIAERLERVAHSGDLSEARSLARQLWTRLDELVTALQRLRQEVAS